MKAALTEEEVAQRGEIALRFYSRLREDPGDSYETFKLPAPVWARGTDSLLRRLAAMVHRLLAP